MRVLIVDDEAPARARLARLLAAHPGVELVGEAADGVAALELVARQAPDALFVDVQMPEVDGFDVAASLPDGGPAIVFVTAHDRYALRAFDTGAADYLLKPVEPARLARALQRLQARLATAQSAQSAAAARLPRPPERLLIAERGGTRVVRCAEIDWLEAADNYVDLHLADRTVLLRRPFGELLADLGPAFVRTHRSVAVALDRVRGVRPRGNGDALVVLASGVEVPCSRPYRAALAARLAPPGGAD